MLLQNYQIIILCVTKNKKRIAQLGEATKNIFNYGSLSSEEIKKFKFEKRSNLIKKFKIPYFLKIIYSQHFIQKQDQK